MPPGVARSSPEVAAFSPGLAGSSPPAAAYSPGLATNAERVAGSVESELISRKEVVRRHPVKERPVETSQVAFFFKKWGGQNKKRAGRLLEGRTWDEMPRAS